MIDSKGTDTVVGDSATLYFQIDRSPFEDFNREGNGFEFDVVDRKASLPDLSAIMNDRDANLTWHIETHLTPSVSLTNQEQTKLPFDDVSFFLSIGVDKISLYNNSAVAVGDFARGSGYH